MNAPPNPSQGATPLPSAWAVLTGPGWPRTILLFLYYLGILIAMLVIYGRGDFTTAPFIYQGF